MILNRFPDIADERVLEIEAIAKNCEISGVSRLADRVWQPTHEADLVANKVNESDLFFQ